ncbi:PQQ-dependent sugar dehydrogenase [Rhizobium sp. L1K21]|uniref:PQQ-dependent sugar dehydrogenase n=1 Tax=Rhizobium sp. L1K21 TaxID=2954933 RepID=UPI002092E005|nr:PQQ-dependent sugar dehydrogenase [Rhizobium sp. L1K21]MCO6186312.1 PQQ-dependent sugar dehydrogenase [Rhizobium sp. L1K21]
MAGIEQFGRSGRLAGFVLSGFLAMGGTDALSAEFSSDEVALKTDVLADGLDHPWSVEVLPDGAYIVSERPGRLRIIRDGAISEPIEGLPDLFVGGQGGLLDIAIPSNFSQSRQFYFTASIPMTGGQGTALFSAVLSEDEAQLENVEKLFEMNKGTQTGHHFGSRIALADNGDIFLTLGERGDGERAQDLGDYAGAVIHLKADGTPYPAVEFTRGAMGLPGMWSKGHRNPQGIDIDPETGRIVVVEHGARGGDEINFPQQGKNYGWPVISYGRHYSGAKIGKGTEAEGYEQPYYYWDPSIAPGALAVYHGEMFPEWEGDFLVTALKFQLLSRLERGPDGAVQKEEHLFADAFGRLRDVKVAPDGAVLLLTDESDGELIRVSRQGD